MSERIDPPRGVDLRRLLTIDVASELRKLSQAQLQGAWQIPAELVRRALRAGAREVEVRTARRQVEITDDGLGIDERHLRYAAVLLDESRPNEERHAALTALEGCSDFVLLALVGLPDRSLRIETTRNNVRWVLEASSRSVPRLGPSSAPPEPGTRIRLGSPELDRRQVCEWLRSVARFAPAEVILDGRPIASGFASVYVLGELMPPLRGRIAIPSEGETAHAWLLEHGIVTGHVSIPEAPCFEAAIELGSDINDLSAARLREQIQPHLVTLIDQGVGLLAELANRAPHVAEPVRARISRLVLAALRKRLRTAEMARAPVFRVVDGQGSRCIDLVALRRSAITDPSGASTLTALYPNQKPERYAIGQGPVLVLDEVERARLAELAGLRFRPPDARDPSTSALAFGRRWLDEARRALVRGVTWLRHPVRSPPVDDARLSEAERALLLALRRHFEAAEGPVRGALMCQGGGPIRRTRKPPFALLLPRDNQVVRAAVRAVSTDPSWAYPAALALLDGRDLPPASARAAWPR